MRGCASLHAVEGNESEGVNIAQTWAAPGVADAATAPAQGDTPAGILPMLPPGTVIIIMRKDPMWAVGQVDTIALGDDSTITAAHLASIQKYHGGGNYLFKAQLKGAFVKGGTATHRIDGVPLLKGQPHPANPDVVRAAAAAPAPSAPFRPAQFGSALGAPPGVPQTDPALMQNIQWLQSQIEALQAGRFTPGVHPQVMPMAQLPPPPPGYTYAPIPAPHQPPNPPAFGTQQDPFSGAKQMMEMIKMVREFDGYGYEEEDEEEEVQGEVTTAGGMPMPKNMEEAMAAMAFIKMQESEDKAKEKETQGGQFPRLIKAGATANEAPAAQVVTTTASPAAAPAADAPLTNADIANAVGKIQKLPSDQQADMLLQLTSTLTADGEVAKALNDKMAAAVASREQKGGEGAA